MVLCNEQKGAQRYDSLKFTITKITMEINPEDFLKRKFKEKSSKFFIRLVIIFTITIILALVYYFLKK